MFCWCCVYQLTITLISAYYTTLTSKLAEQIQSNTTHYLQKETILFNLFNSRIQRIWKEEYKPSIVGWYNNEYNEDQRDHHGLKETPRPRAENNISRLRSNHMYKRVYLFQYSGQIFENIPFLKIYIDNTYKYIIVKKGLSKMMLGF